MRKLYCIFLLSLGCLLNKLIAQPIVRYNSFSFNVNEGLLQTTIGNMAVDKNNFCWISFPNGIQQFDGQNFTTIKIQPGLPDDKYAKFFRCSNGELLIGHSKGISKYEIETNKFREVYQQAAGSQKSPLFISEVAGNIYFMDESATIISMRSSDFSIVQKTKTPFPPYHLQAQNIPGLSHNVINNKVGFLLGTIIYIWDLVAGKLVSQSPPLVNCSPFFLYLLSEEKALYYTYNDNRAIQCWDFSKGTNNTLVFRDKDDGIHIGRLIILPWRDKFLLSVNNHLYETDPGFQTLKAELVNYQNQPICGIHSLNNMIEDNFGNLYLQTISGGIKKIIRNNYPVKYYGSDNKAANLVIGILPDKKNNRLLVGTNGNGVYIFDTLQQLIRHFSKLPNTKPGFGANAIIKNSKGDYLLFVPGEKKLWRLSSDLSNFTELPVSHEDSLPYETINYFGSTLYQDSTETIVQSMYQFYRINLQHDQAMAKWVTGEYVLSRLWYEGKIISHANNELIFYDGQTFREIKKIPFPNTGGVRCYAKDQQGHIYIGTNKGIFTIDPDGRILSHWNKEKGLPDECIYSMSVDRSGDLWCSSNKGIFRIRDGNIFHLTKEDGLQENEFNTNVVAATEDGEIYFGGVNGVSSFYPSVISGFDEKIKVVVTHIRVNNQDIENDKAPWNIERIKLSYDQNSISFDFVAMANNNPSQYIYQYRMSGLDKEWIQNNGLQTVRYSLSPGKYVFQLFASRSFEKDAAPMKEIVIIVRPPFWKTWWFLTVLSVLLLSFLTFGINQRNKRKYAKKLQQLENERQIKLERERISKDLHDSLGAYANAVLYNTDLLEKEKTEQKRHELIADLKFASKDIITSLRETVWALKKENYTAEDCLLRIRNFIQPFTRYYEHIHFKVTGDAPAGRVLHYTKALNLVRIVQESISNSIKHACPSSIIVSSFPMENKWKMVIADDGKGFDLTTARQEDQGNGLHNMQHRAAEAGFEFAIETNKGGGTTITIIV